MTEIRNFKSVLGIEYWNLRFNCNLVLGIWDFELFDALNDFYDFNDLPLTARSALSLPALSSSNGSKGSLLTV
jgi:hypothetical protein